MTYLIADIHGCFQEFCALLKKIDFSETDELFVLGDAMDRGPAPIRTLQSLMRCPNIRYILGNHDMAALSVLRPLLAEITDDSIENLPQDLFLRYAEWMQNGGAVTLRQFRELPRDQQEDLLNYLEEASLYETIAHEDRLFVLVHAGLDRFDPAKELEDYAAEDFLFARADYGKPYFPGGRIFLVTGHTPTALIRPDRQPRVYTENGHIAIDCGCVFGGALAADCIETGEAVYVDSMQQPGGQGES